MKLHTKKNYIMRAVIQRVSKASVMINGIEKSTIAHGILVLLGIENKDTDKDIEWLAGKITRLRIFDDENGVMNKSVLDVNGSLMIVSQFTLHANTKKGNRPSYIRASKPDFAVPMYEKFIRACQAVMKNRVRTGEFGADMKIELTNDGPVTIILDTKNMDF